MSFEDEIVNAIPDHGILVESTELLNFITPVQSYAPLPAPMVPPSTNDNLREDNPLQVRDADIIYAVSDGSMDPVSGHANFDWISTVEERFGTISCSKPVHANPKYITLLRAEMAGLYDMLKYLDGEGLHQEIRMFCDSKGCIKVLLNLNPTGLTNLNESESDLTVVIRRLLPKFHNLHLACVFAHQDDNVPVSELPSKTQINVECDSEAKKCM